MASLIAPASLPLQELVVMIADATRRGLSLPPGVMEEVWRQEVHRRGLVPWASFTEFVDEMQTGPTPLTKFEHIPLMLQTAERVLSGEILALLVLMPTRYQKSTVFAQLLPAYYLRRWPAELVGIASHTAALAWKMSDKAREFFRASGGVLREGVEAKKLWGTDAGGECWASGVGEPIMGQGFNLGVVDDPSDPEKAKSPAFQVQFEDFWREKWVRGRQPIHRAGLPAPLPGRLIVVMQRLGVDDPVDFLFRREVGENADLAPMHWHVLVLDEIKSDEPLGRWNGPQGLPPTCTLIQDTRTVGQILSPSWIPPEEVRRAQEDVGPVAAATQRQQRPFKPSGDFWKEDWFGTYDVLPKHAFNGGSDWDTAYGKNERNSASARCESYRGATRGQQPNGQEIFDVYVHDIWWEWKEFPDLVQAMQVAPGPHYVEQKASGKSVVQAVAAQGIKAYEVPVKGDKLARASAVQPTVAQGRVYVRKEIKQRLLYGELQGLLRVTSEQLAAGTGGLDVNDVFVQALHRHLGLGAEKKRVAGSWVR